ncbi:hypothetical protein [Hymenobacter cavernae]|uniref:AP2 domain-containing protein n=1 Tax=Hymenobacter cavernae TaxID=2044852 RepID=A0ABQ1USX2_9BACT|nr:hypothetical protein [Hymenobacter cavernae]GGF26373.1 hypothetical protein GCM10011383_42360 [Hymenobacter cavernae]
MKRLDLKGQQFGRLTVNEFAGSKRVGNRYRTFWQCECECGQQTEVNTDNLRNGTTQSCGCLHRESTAAINYKHGEANYSKENKTWFGIKARCYNPNAEKYPQYGERGITVCERWLDSYEDFLLDMGRAPTKDHSIERIDVNGNYEPSNCRWATAKEQANNKTTNVFLELNGVIKTLAQWAETLGYNYKSFHRYIRYQNKSLADLARARGYNLTS